MWVSKKAVKRPEVEPSDEPAGGLLRSLSGEPEGGRFSCAL